MCRSSTSSKSPNTFRLAFVPDRQSGRPKLKVVGDRKVSEYQIHCWERELNRNYERLCSGCAEFTFSTGRGLPKTFRVEVKQTGFRGMASLLLTPANGASNSSSPGLTSDGLDSSPKSTNRTRDSRAGEPVRADHTTPSSTRLPSVERFGKAFSTALGDYFSRLPVLPEHKPGVEIVLREIRELGREHPDELLLILLSAYLRSVNERSTDGNRRMACMATSYVVDELCSVLLDETGAPQGPSPPRFFSRNVAELSNRLAANHHR